MADAAAEVGIEVGEQFTTAEQHRHAATLGMWVFLLTELLLFSGLLLVALVLRLVYPDSTHAAASHLNMWLGGINTFVLLCSSLTMSGAIELSKMGRQRGMVRCMLATAGLGTLFVLIKGYEYYTDFQEHITPFLNRRYELAGDTASHLFVNLYYITTSLHGAHLTLGIVIMLVMARLAGREGFLAHHQNRIEITGLYWHFIDLVWILVYPTLYLVNR